MHTIAADNNVSLADSIMKNHADPIAVFENVRDLLACPNFRLIRKALIQNLMIPISLKNPEIISVSSLEL